MDLLKKYGVSVEAAATPETVWSLEEVDALVEEVDAQADELTSDEQEVTRLETAEKEIVAQDTVAQNIVADREDGKLTETEQAGLQLARRAVVSSLGIDPESEEGQELVDEVTDTPATAVAQEAEGSAKGLLAKLREAIKKGSGKFIEKVQAFLKWIKEKALGAARFLAGKFNSMLGDLRELTKEEFEKRVPNARKLLDSGYVIDGKTKKGIDDKVVYANTPVFKKVAEATYNWIIKSVKKKEDNDYVLKFDNEKVYIPGKGDVSIEDLINGKENYRFGESKGATMGYGDVKLLEQLGKDFPGLLKGMEEVTKIQENHLKTVKAEIDKMANPNNIGMAMGTNAAIDGNTSNMDIVKQAFRVQGVAKRLAKISKIFAQSVNEYTKMVKTSMALTRILLSDKSEPAEA